jgi:undecaprenyl-phosphate galactose phosphotransferase
MDDSGGNVQWISAGSNSALSPGTALSPRWAAPISRGDTRSALEFSSTYSYCKRVVDVVGAIVLALAFLPVVVIVLLSVRRDGGDVLFRHTRVGKNGKPIQVYKFRTMVANADKVLSELIANDPSAREEWFRDHKLKNDPRITQVGKFLRRTSLDELPQLWNVLRGEMSLVGPRPIILEELPKYGRAARYYLAVKPGLTGVWQVGGRNDTDYRRRVAMDRYYASAASLRIDLIVLIKTVGVVLGKRGAY